MARRGIALVPDEIEYAVNTGMKAGMIDVKKNTVVIVIEKNGLQEAGGASHIIFGGEYADMMMLGSRDSLLCTELEVTLPTDNSYKWLLFVACYCFPFMHTLTLNRRSPVTYLTCSEHSAVRAIAGAYAALRQLPVAASHRGEECVLCAV